MEACIDKILREEGHWLPNWGHRIWLFNTNIKKYWRFPFR